MMFGKGFKINNKILLLVFVAAISVFINTIPEYFKAEQRLIAFALMITTIGPLITNNHLIRFRVALFETVNWFIRILVLISFFSLIIGLSYAFGYSGFIGMFNHSMFLGPMAGIAAITSLHKFYIHPQRKKKIIFLMIVGASLITGIAAGSRAALIATFGGVLFLLYKMSHGRVLKIVKALLVIFLVGVITYPIWEEYTAFITHKMESTAFSGSLTSSRDFLWKARLQEFKSSPIIGIGFAAADPNLDSKIDFESGGIEPGTSWLSVLSMTGILGFSMVLFIIGSNFLYCLKKNEIHQKESALYLGLIVFFILHFFAEGYIFAAGSGLFFYFWLLIANTEIFRKIRSLK